MNVRRPRPIKRRTKLHKQLLGFGTPVQYSVFECLVTAQELTRMQEMVARTIKPRLDHVRYYHLCTTCQAKVTTTRAGVEVTSEADGWVV